MTTEAGEYIVGAYLQHHADYDCPIILYNSRVPGGGLGGLPELDVIGLNLKRRTAYLCEVTTHLHGMRPIAAEKAAAKFIQQQQQYASAILDGFSITYMLWSPKVYPGPLKKLAKVKGVTLIVNEKYTHAVNWLRTYARDNKHDTGNPAMRVMQILAHLHMTKPPASPKP